MTTHEIEIDVSPEQEDSIVDHVFQKQPLGMPAGERVWIINQARKQHPGCRVLAADLNIKTLKWSVTVEV